MKLGIIGATGMLGHHLAIAAQIRQYELVVIHRPQSDLSNIRDLRFEAREADLSDKKSLIDAFEGLNAVANCAAYYPTAPKPLSEEIKIARLQMKFFLTAVAKAKVERALYVGGDAVLPKVKQGLANEKAVFEKQPDGGSNYVQIKWLMDQMARDAAKEGLPVIIGIPSMTFGSYDFRPTTGKLIVEIANNTLKGYVNGNRNVVSAEDAGRGLLLALEKGEIGERYLITGENTDIKTIVKTIGDCANVTVPKMVLPLSVAKIFSKVQEIKYALLKGSEPQLSATALSVLAGSQHLDGSKAKVELNYTPDHSMQEAVEKAFIWFERNGYITPSVL